MACKRSTAPQTLNTHTIGTAQRPRVESATVAMSARMAATRSPYATGTVNAEEREGETTPGIRKLSPTNRNVCGTTRDMRPASRGMTRTCGQQYNLVTMPKATKLIRMLRPNNARLFTDRLHELTVSSLEA